MTPMRQLIRTRLTASLALASALAVGVTTLVGCSSGIAFDRTPAHITLASDPAELAGDWCVDFFMVHATINGAGPYRLLLDTGSTLTLVDDEVAADLRDAVGPTNISTKGGGGYSVAADAQLHIDTFQSGGVTLRDFDAVVMDLDKFAPAIGRIDGIVGFTALRGTSFVIDYPNRSVQVGNERLDAKASRGEDEAWFRYGHASRPRVVIEAADREMPVLVDSGSGSGFALQSFDDLPLTSEPIVGSASMNLDIIVLKRIARLDGELTMDRIRYEQPVVLSDPKGSKLGTEVMAAHRWTFDTRQQLIRIDDGPALIAASPEVTLGFVATLTPAGMEVVSVQSGSPAEASGVRSGDFVRSINGVSVDAFKCGGARDATARAHPIVIELTRGDDVVQVELNRHTALP
jgi:hypothetical protein